MAYLNPLVVDDSVVNPEVVRFYYATLLTFAQWQTASGGDANSVQADPLFHDPESGAYRLQVGSPGLGTGTFVTGLTIDMKGDPFYDETHGVSMGAINLAPDVTRELA